MKVSIIGTNGFLSKNISRFYNSKKVLLDLYGRSTPEDIKFNLFNPIDLLKEDFPIDSIKESDIVIYAVGAGIQSNIKDSSNNIYNLNVFTPVKIINALNSTNFSGTFITFGSYFEIGENNENRLFKENDLLHSTNRTSNEYSISKRMFSKFISSLHVNFKTLHFILPTIYGEDESSHRLIPSTINSLKTNNQIEFTSGDQIRQYIYIDEIPKIVQEAFEKDIPSGIYNVAGTQTLTVKELVTELFNAFNKKIPMSVFGKAHRTDTGMKVLNLDGTKLMNLIDYKPSIKIIDVYEKY
jgi:nucleoside-diphosphate-sugar epimerase